MKTYILDSINRFKRFSERLDVATTLTNKTWVVFNDTGERELYIFQPDGSVIITSNGVGIRGQWQWISANKSLIIHRKDTVIMLHPEYIDNTILALNLDGTREMAFLIEDGNRESFAPKSLVQLEMYFENKEQKMLLEQRQEGKRRAEEQRRIREQQRVEDERRRLQIQREKEEEKQRQIQQDEKNKRERLIGRAMDISIRLRPGWYDTIPVIVAVVVSIIFIFWSFSSDLMGIEFLLAFVFGPISGLISYGLLKQMLKSSAQETFRKNLQKWKEQHPNDEYIKYIKF